MAKWTKKRQRYVRRRKDGTFKAWKGGRKKKDLKKKENNFHGIATHIGKEFKRQFGRKARVGDMVRTKTRDGTYHKQAQWYIRTKYGWRDSGQTRKPSRSQKKSLMERAREGRRHY